MLFGKLVLDGYGYGVSDNELPKADEFGQPTEEMVALKELSFRENETGLEITIRFTQEGFSEFAKNMSAARISFASSLGDLPTLDKHLVDRHGKEWQ